MTQVTREKIESLEEEIDRLTDLLQGYMRFKHRTVRDVERDLDWGRGTLNRIFSGRSELKLRHILEVAATLDLSPEDFFHMAYEVLPKGATTVERVMAMLDALKQRAQVKSMSSLSAQLDVDLVRPILEQMVQSMLADTLGTKPKEEPKAPEAGPKPRSRRGKGKDEP
ncbi:MAG TPA: helix-turn-helix transcriptional regulator [Thermoanaerobaculia bacterium]|jgi:hypothetical protein|nr:helix-turn-helix transcriptional regulator [Thermoanaerobaculia bacterium]